MKETLDKRLHELDDNCHKQSSPLDFFLPTDCLTQSQVPIYPYSTLKNKKHNEGDKVEKSTWTKDKQ